MREALGLVETRGLSNAILVADAMSKTANINIIGLENTRGIGYMTIKVSGDVGAVQAAVTCGKQIAIENNSFVTAKVIPRPSNNIEVTFCQPENKNNDVSKENTSIEKDNSKGNVIESSDMNKEIIQEEEKHLENITSETKNVEVKIGEISAEMKKDDVQETQVKKEEETDMTDELPAESNSIELKASSIEKTKTRRSSRKKAEPKKKEE